MGIKDNFILREFIDTGQVGNIMQTESPRHCRSYLRLGARKDGHSPNIAATRVAMQMSSTA